MAKRSLFVFVLAIALVTTAARAETYGVVLTAAGEAPPTSSSAFGNGTVTLDAAHTSMTVVLNVTGLTGTITGAHIHGEAAVGANAGVKINFDPATNIVNGRMNRTFTIDKALGDAIAAKPELYYANVHTAQFPNGEIRGQLTANDTVLTLAAELRGANEVPVNPSSAIGSAFVTLDSNNVVSWEVNTTGIASPRAGHIHEQIAGVNGNIVVAFANDATGFSSPGRLKGSGAIDPALAARLRANPAGFYVNVHSVAFTGGEIRGQLTPANEYDIAVAGKATGANGENFVTDVRIFNPSYTARAAGLAEFFPSTAPGGPNASTSIPFDIPARGTAVLNDIAGASGLNIGSGIGALRVTSVSQLAVTSTIYDDRRARNGGTIGQFVPAVSRANALRRGVLAQLANNAGTRTNVGLFNPNQLPVDVRFELRDPAGAVVGTGTFTAPALSLQQSSIGTYFPGVDLSNRAALSLSFAASAPIHVYASTVDNVSADQIYLSAVSDPGEP